MASNEEADQAQSKRNQIEKIAAQYIATIVHLPETALCVCVCENEHVCLLITERINHQGGSQFPESGKTRQRPQRHVLFTHVSVHFHLSSVLRCMSAVPWMDPPCCSPFIVEYMNQYSTLKNRKGCY